MSHRESVGTAGVRLRPIGPEDQAFLYEVYASTRADEMARLDWHEAQKRAFLRMQFEAQHKDYTARYRGARFDIMELDGEPIGRLYVDRRKGEIHVIDIALLPAYRGRGIGGWGAPRIHAELTKLGFIISEKWIVLRSLPYEAAHCRFPATARAHLCRRHRPGAPPVQSGSIMTKDN